MFIFRWLSDGDNYIKSKNFREGVSFSYPKTDKTDVEVTMSIYSNEAYEGGQYNINNKLNGNYNNI